jgi:DNA-binding PadR family transcriptional regulator
VSKKPPRRDPDALLPLKPALYLILLTLAEGDHHGYALKKAVARRTNGKVKLGPGTLYRSIKQLVDQRLVEESGDRPDPALDDERRRYYRLTSFGRDVAAAETERLSTLVAAARASNLVRDTKPV